MNGSKESASPEISEADAMVHIQQYCTVCWRNAHLPADQWGDATQEVFMRLLECIPQERWGEVFHEDHATDSPHREFLRAIDTVKKRIQRTRIFADLPTHQFDQKAVHCRTQEEDIEAVLTIAQSLSQKLRDVIVLMLSGNGYSHTDIATILGRTADRLYDDKYKAIRKLRLLLHVRA